MKNELKLIIRHFVNQDIVQRGWNRIRIKFDSNVIALRPIKITPLVHTYLDARDPNRFFSKGGDFKFDAATSELVFPPFRLEYFEQIVEFSREVEFEAELLEMKPFDLVACLMLDFTHYPLEIPKTAPERFDKLFSTQISFHNMLLPAAQFYVESFADAHFGRLEMMFAWRVAEFSDAPNEIVLAQLEEYLFEKLYGATFDEYVSRMRNMKYFGSELELLPEGQIEDTLANQLVDDGQTVNLEYEKLDKVFSALLSKEFSIETIEQDVRVHQGSFEVFFVDENDESDISLGSEAELAVCDAPLAFNDSVRRKKSALVASVLAPEHEVRKRQPGFRRAGKAESEAPPRDEFDNLDSHATETDEVTQDLCATDTESLGCFSILQREDVVERQNVQVPEQEQFRELFLAAYELRRGKCAIRTYAPMGLPYLRRLPQLEITTDEYLRKAGFPASVNAAIRSFSAQEVPRAARNGSGYHMVFFVHGYQGNLNDLRFLRNLLVKLATLQGSQQRLVAVLCKQFYKNALPELALYELGYQLATEVTHHMALNGITKDTLEAISFVGFSLGNLVISACVQTDQFQQYLPYLRAFISINGPHLGARSERRIVNFGLAFLKCFSGEKCITELENCVFADLANYAGKYRFLKAVQQAQNPAQQFKILDVLAAGSLNSHFQHVVLIGSEGDGYVRQQSAICEARSGEEKLLGHIVATNNMRFVLVTNKHNVYHGGQLDAKTGRNIHVNPLISPTSAELLVKACYDLL